MSEYLIPKQWGYQTCCPDEEKIIGYFKPEDPDTIKFYSKPSFDSEELNKEKNRKHEDWKYNNADPCNMTLQQMSKTFGNIYNVVGSELLIGRSNPIWGWEEVKDKDNHITWIRVDEYEQIWAPYNSYDYSTSDEEDDDNFDIDNLKNNNSSDEDSSEEIKNLCTECGINMGPNNPRQLCGKTRCLDSPKDEPSSKKAKIEK